MKVLYIVGKGRSGSTLLTSILGELPAFFAGGELRLLWRGWTEGFVCGCRREIPKCELWSRVVPTTLERAGTTGTGGRGAAGSLTADHVRHWEAEIHQWSRAPKLMLDRSRRRIRWPALKAYAEVTSSLYRQIASAVNCRVVVDSSKWPIDPVVLGMVPHVEPYVLHLVRDPRAVAHSWQRRKAWDPVRTAPMPSFSTSYTAASWVIRTLSGELAGRGPGRRFLRLRYEDLVRDPRVALEEIASFVGESPGGLEFLSGRTVTLGGNHTVAGNPSRFSHGSIALSPDEAWRREMPTLARYAVTAITFPLLRRYRYTVTPSGTAQG